MPKKKGLLLPFCPQTTFSPVVDIASLCHPNQRTQKREFATNRAINSHMEKSVRWLLFEYQDLELVIMSKSFKTPCMVWRYVWHCHA